MPVNLMRQNGLLSVLASTSLIGGCAANNWDKSEETYPLTLRLLNANSKSKEELQKIWSELGPPLTVDIKRETGLYEGYFVEAMIKESKLEIEGEEKEKMYCLWIVDCQEGEIKARIYAKTRFGSEYPPRDFLIYQAPNPNFPPSDFTPPLPPLPPQIVRIPKGHPFESYTSEKLAEIYNLITKE